MPNSRDDSNDKAELQSIARNAMRTYGLEPDFPAAARAQVARLQPETQNGLRDLRGLAWSSIDNDDSRDLDQLEVCSADAGAARHACSWPSPTSTALVPRESPLDAHAATNTTSVYTPALIFPMLPPELSTDLTSLNEGEERPAVVDRDDDRRGRTRRRIATSIARSCAISAQLAYNAVGCMARRSRTGSGRRSAAVAGSRAQLRLQDQLASRLQARRDRGRRAGLRARSS